jgi:hypothetical protein
LIEKKASQALKLNDPVEAVHDPVPVEDDQPGGEAGDDGAFGERDVQQALERLPGQHVLPHDVTEEDQPDQEVGQQGAEEAELCPGLDELSQAQLRALGRVVSHEDPADHRARHDRDDRRHDAEAELDACGAEHDRERA